MIKFLKSSEKKAGCVRRKFRWLWCQIWCHDDKPTNIVLLHKVARRCLEWVLGFVHKPVETSTCLLIRANDWLKWLYSNTQSSARIIRLNRILAPMFTFRFGFQNFVIDFFFKCLNAGLFYGRDIEFCWYWRGMYVCLTVSFIARQLFFQSFLSSMNPHVKTNLISWLIP